MTRVNIVEWLKSKSLVIEGATEEVTRRRVAWVRRTFKLPSLVNSGRGTWLADTAQLDAELAAYLSQQAIVRIKRQETMGAINNTLRGLPNRGAGTKIDAIALAAAKAAADVRVKTELSVKAAAAAEKRKGGRPKKPEAGPTEDTP